MYWSVAGIQKTKRFAENMRSVNRERWERGVRARRDDQHEATPREGGAGRKAVELNMPLGKPHACVSHTHVCHPNV